MGNKRKLKNCRILLWLCFSTSCKYSNVKLHKKMSIIKIQFIPERKCWVMILMKNVFHEFKFGQRRSSQRLENFLQLTLKPLPALKPSCSIIHQQSALKTFRAGLSMWNFKFVPCLPYQNENQTSTAPCAYKGFSALYQHSTCTRFTSLSSQCIAEKKEKQTFSWSFYKKF